MDGLPTLVVTHQLQVERRTGKVRWPETNVLPLCHATNCYVSRQQKTVMLVHFGQASSNSGNGYLRHGRDGAVGVDGWMTDGLLYSTCVTGHLMSVVGLSRTPPPHTHTHHVCHYSTYGLYRPFSVNRLAN